MVNHWNIHNDDFIQAHKHTHTYRMFLVQFVHFDEIRKEKKSATRKKRGKCRIDSVFIYEYHFTYRSQHLPIECSAFYYHIALANRDRSNNLNFIEKEFRMSIERWNTMDKKKMYTKTMSHHS